MYRTEDGEYVFGDFDEIIDFVIDYGFVASSKYAVKDAVQSLRDKKRETGGMGDWINIREELKKLIEE